MQMFRVLRCADCDLFQVTLVTMARKWTCNVCGLKQGVFKIHFTSPVASDCREAAQKLNMALKDQNESNEQTVIEQLQQAQASGQSFAGQTLAGSSSTMAATTAQPSRGSSRASTSSGRRARPRLTIPIFDHSDGPDCDLEVLSFEQIPFTKSMLRPFEKDDLEAETFSEHLDGSSQGSSSGISKQQKKMKISDQDENSAAQSNQDFWNNLF